MTAVWVVVERAVASREVRVEAGTAAEAKAIAAKGVGDAGPWRPQPGRVAVVVVRQEKAA